MTQNKHKSPSAETPKAQSASSPTGQMESIRVNVDLGGHFNGLFQIWNQDGNEISDEEERKLRPILEAAPELLEACKFFMGALADGDLVRDITKDARPEWALKMIKFVSDLGKAQLAINKAEGRQ